MKKKLIPILAFLLIAFSFYAKETEEEPITGDNNEIDSINVNSFFVKLWYVKNNITTEITKGRIYYGSDWQFDDYHPYQDMRGTFKNYNKYLPYYERYGILLVVQSRPSLELEGADKFVVDMFLDCQIDGEETVIHRVDTLYPKEKTRKGFSVH